MARYGDKVEQQFKEALKSKNVAALNVLRMAKAALTNERISKQKDLTEEDEIAVLRREVKKREEAAASYKEAGADSRAEAELAEAELLGNILPAEMSDDDIAAVVRKVIDEQNLSGYQDFGRAMGAVMKEIGSQASGERVSEIVKKELQR